MLNPGAVVAYLGDLGMGKTAFTRGLAAGLGYKGRVTSPTFAIVNEYEGGRLPLFHFDMYRLNSADDLFDIGWEDYLSRGGVCAVEWSENVMDALPEDTVWVRIAREGGHRPQHYHRRSGASMKILALETSAKAVSAAVSENGRILAAGYQDTGLTHSRTLMPIVEHILKNTDLKLSDMDAIAVAVGPGSFTGIRIGVSAAKGLAFSVDKPAVGVSTLAAMARNAAFADG